jgi:thiol-disulfide isomerase/thioredoxin
MNPIFDTQNRDSGRRIRRWSLAVALALLIIASLALSYEVARLLRDWPVGVFSRGSLETVTANRKDLQFSFLEQPAELPEIRFVDANDQPRLLSSFRGRPILLNLWATWCVPCRNEMPALDRLQAKFDPSEFLVLALSVDRQSTPAIKRFYQDLGLKSLGIYADPSGEALTLVRGPGLPTTLFVNSDGKEIGRKIGPAKWDSPEILALLRQRMNLPSNPDGTAK